MNIKLTNTFLFVKDFKTSKKFYIENLDQKIYTILEGYVVFTSGLALWELPKDSIITKSLQERLNRQGNNRIELYFEADDIDLYFNLKNSSGLCPGV